MDNVAHLSFPLSLQGSVEMCFHITDPSDWIQAQISRGLIYENDLLSFISFLRIKKGIFLDIGSYIGTHSIFFSAVMGRRVISVEAFPASYNQLLSNIELNKLSSMIKPIQKVIGNRSSDYYQFVERSKDNGGMNAAVRCSSHDLHECRRLPGRYKSVSIDRLKIEELALLKIDVEGMEMAVLDGAMGTIDKSRPVLAIECSSYISSMQIFSFCRSKGYACVGIYGATPVAVFVHRSQVFDVCHGIPLPSLDQLFAILQNRLK